MKLAGDAVADIDLGDAVAFLTQRFADSGAEFKLISRSADSPPFNTAMWLRVRFGTAPSFVMSHSCC